MGRIMAFLCNLPPARRKSRREMAAYYLAQRRGQPIEVECDECHFVNLCFDRPFPCWWCGAWVD
jgi:ribosomal protein S27E